MNSFPLEQPTIRAEQPIGEFFLCSLSAETLLRVAYSIPATTRTDSEGFLSGIQRRLSNARAKEIGDYIDNEESTFPNTIILSANYSEDGHYEEDETLRWHVREANDRDHCHVLVIPSDKRLASIVDGQHRLEGFKHVTKQERLQMQLPCAVFINLPRAYQANIFATINFNQKRVDKSLAYQLFGYDLRESNRAKWPPDMLALFLARTLNRESQSPFCGHVKLAVVEIDGQSTENDGWKVSIATLVEGITKLISGKPTADRNALLQGVASTRADLSKNDSMAPLRRYYLDEEDLIIYDTVADYFGVVAEVLWEKATRDSFITRTVGILALFDVLRRALLLHKVSVENVKDTSRALLVTASAADFSDNYFHASGAGRVRIRKILEYATGLRSQEELGQDVVNEAQRILRSMH